MPVPLLAIADSNDSLRIAIPCNIIDSSGDDVVVACTSSASLSVSFVSGGPFDASTFASRTFCSAFACAIPDLDSSRQISTCYVEPRGRETGYRGLGGVLRVLFTDGGVVDGAQED